MMGKGFEVTRIIFAHFSPSEVFSTLTMQIQSISNTNNPSVPLIGNAIIEMLWMEKLTHRPKINS